ncbi:MAG: flippase [Beijerinckiaceae bacterium]
MSWASGEQILRMAIGLLITVALARHLGPVEFGIYSLVLATVGMVGALIPLSVDHVIQRHLIAEPTQEAAILGSATALRIFAMAVAVVIAAVAIFWLERGNDTAILLAVLGASTVFFHPLETISVWFASQLKIKNVALARTPAFLAMSLARLTAIWIGSPVPVFLAISGIEGALVAMGLAAAYRAAGGSVRRWRVSKDWLERLFFESWPLLVGGLTAALYLRLDVVMLAALRNDAEVGIYGAATRISEVWYFLPMALMASVQPLLLRLRTINPERFRQRLLVCYTLLGWISIILAAVISLISVPMCIALFGPSFASSGAVLAIHIWAAVPVFLGVISSTYLVAENLGKISMYRTTIGLIVNIVLNFAFIPTLGAAGAAWATLLAYLVATFSLVVFPATRAHGWSMITALSLRSLVDACKTIKIYVDQQKLFK